ncbi:aldo/keto reductase [Myroides marinus]|uniref:aldo/keto reductase n=1 Tax=Myroides marinus TaxID=703342 RepID=UPI002578E012|nr:aldo/keto reductase [Myroides marinus]MDM1378414.1 aldo/keto reductase [Myroides marinus]MDM1385552.1 aldo/keto reductase [Myroides marinus]MDM1392898.1 aldo/keto reductase [Myroides marinus]
MKKYKLGKSELEVPALSFGGNVFGWTLDEKASFKMLDELYESGLTFIDTANNYSHWAPGNVGGESEAIIGKWFKESKKRHGIVLSTKVGGRMGDGTRGLKKEYIYDCVDASLKRLQTDYIDLYFSHYDDLETSQEETMEAFNDLIKAGKVRYLGASNLEVDRIVSSNAIARDKGWAEYIAIQPLYNLYDRVKYEQEYLSLVEEEKLAVMSYFALASGFLSGKYRSLEDVEMSARKDMVKGYINERGLNILSVCDKIAKDHNATIAEVAIAWQIHKPSISTPIVSATSNEQLKSLLRSVDIKLSVEEMTLLDKVSAY